MNRLCSMAKYFRNLSEISKICNAKNLIVVGSRNQLRLVSSDTKASPTNQQTIASQNELDKPQWERSDRYKIFYGFDANDEAKDKVVAHFFTFTAFLGFFFVPFLMFYYYPDYKTNDWCYREAYLEISRREKAGLPLVDPDYVPSEQINLPSEEDIGDTEIIL
ncbi:NADH dehydrogenase [ubiquinone] 1 beta subcomplex subunit mitochondrial [Brachionus plicatilis]|uniref:NADH dehydrogenase [ubiquinone] 1 beta subcomplex subunit 11, mitochondrial n=1 Tax=Brachionus plicatilis TaxID=10195 RepID=A0A3M7PB67_BRAPC|nr:NADH dehydrogenase [ubiquinone] 1 beta subcomplex subunit mitochondrial [Brachionus plicatilis]